MRGKIFVWCFIILVIVNSNFVNSQEDTITPFFSITLLAPNTGSAPPWVYFDDYIAPEIEKIGIDVNCVCTMLGYITPRVWNYPGPYPIPKYSEGGYDIFLGSYSWICEWNPKGLFETTAITPNGDNYYQFSNPEMDLIISNLNNSINEQEKLDLLKDAQEILYNELPVIPIVEPAMMYIHNENLSGQNFFLWSTSQQSMYNWSLSDQNILRFAIEYDEFNFYPSIHYNYYYYNVGIKNQIYPGLMERNLKTKYCSSNLLINNISTLDGLTYSITINSDILWADGTPFTIEDIIYNYQLAVTPYDLNYLYDEACQYWDNNSVVKLSDTDFSFTFKKKQLFQERFFTLPLLPKHIWEFVAPENHYQAATNWSQNFPEKIFGCGPYKLGEYNETQITLVKNDFYEFIRGNNANFNEIHFKNYYNYYYAQREVLDAFEENEIDIILPEFFESGFTIYDGRNFTNSIVPSGGLWEIGINMYHPYLGTGESCPIAGEESAKHIRRAINFIIPRDEIILDLYNGYALPGITSCPSTSFGFDNSLTPIPNSYLLALEEMVAAGFDVENILHASTSFVGLSFVEYLILLALVGGNFILITFKSKKY